jgi:hypothetical protein
MTTFTQKGVTRPGVVLPRQLNYESKLLFHLRAADLLLGHDPLEDVAQAITGEDPTFSRTTAGGYTRDALGFLRQWGKGVPRLKCFDLDGDGYWEEPGVLLEGQRENGFTKSIELDDGAWGKVRSSCAGAAVDAIEAPDGTATADKLVEDGTASSSHTFQRNTPALTDNTQQSFSLFAKASGRSEFQIELVQKDGTGATAWFDLSAGTVGTEAGGAVGLIEKYADGWYRCMIMADSAAGGSTPVIVIRMGSGGEDLSYSGDGASGIYFWGMQFEVDAAFPSSFILTAGAAVTRNADSLAYTLATLGLTLDDLTDDFTVYARMARPFHADAVGSIVADANICQLSSTAALLESYFDAASRIIEAQIDTATTDRTANQSVPSGAAIETTQQFRNLNTGGSLAVDVGSGLSAFSAAATAFSAFGDTTLTIGSGFYGALFDLKVGRGLRTMKQMRESF